MNVASGLAAKGVAGARARGGPRALRPAGVQARCSAARPATGCSRSPRARSRAARRRWWTRWRATRRGAKASAPASSASRRARRPAPRPAARHGALPAHRAARFPGCAGRAGRGPGRSRIPRTRRGTRDRGRGGGAAKPIVSRMDRGRSALSRARERRLGRHRRRPACRTSATSSWPSSARTARATSEHSRQPTFNAGARVEGSSRRARQRRRPQRARRRRRHQADSGRAVHGQRLSQLAHALPHGPAGRRQPAEPPSRSGRLCRRTSRPACALRVTQETATLVFARRLHLARGRRARRDGGRSASWHRPVARSPARGARRPRAGCRCATRRCSRATG